MTKTALLYVLAFLSFFSLNAQTGLVFRAFDIDTTTWPNITNMTVYKGKLHFTKSGGANDSEPWISDGTVSGTTMLKKIGYKGAYANSYAEINGKLYFTASDSAHGRELWVTDGTSQGTQLAVDIIPGRESSSPYYTLPIGNSLLFFRVEDSAHGSEPWVSDGTPSGTFMLADIWPGEKGSHTSFELLQPQQVAFNGKVYFGANDSTHGYELWVTDGTKQGTHIVKDITPGNSESAPRNFSVYNNKLYFLTYTADYGREWWVTDGTEAGTKLLMDIAPGKASGADLWMHLQQMVEYRGKAYFTATNPQYGSELWEMDGTTTRLALDVVPGSVGSELGMLAVYNDRLYFSGPTPWKGKELWVTDLTDTGTRMLKDINQGPASSHVSSYVVYKNHLYFVADAGDREGRQLFRTDGTEQGTVMIKKPNSTKFGSLDDYGPNPPGDYYPAPIVFNSSLFFRADYDSTGRDLWSLTDTATYTHIAYKAVAHAIDFSIYPNPGKTKFSVRLNEAIKGMVRIDVTDIAGVSVYTQQVKIYGKQIQLELPQLPSGTYIVRLQNDDAIATQKLLISE